MLGASLWSLELSCDVTHVCPLLSARLLSSSGLRKPDRRIYELVQSRLRSHPSRVVFLDDIGANLKAARALGWHTIRVGVGPTGVTHALHELERLVGRSLVVATRGRARL